MNSNVSSDESIDDRGLIVSVIYTNQTEDFAIAYRWPALLLIFVSLIGILGNVLVCLAIGSEKRLHNRTNWFLFSLAFADLLVSALVIPLAIVKEFAGFWILGPIVCDLWIFFDVCSCTSSIMHIVVISIDRYCAINDPLNVRSRQEYSQILPLIVLIWSIAIFLSSPMIVLGILNRYNILVNGQCFINNQFFVIYGSVVSFVIPLIIVLVMYTLTVRRLREQIKEGRKHFAQEQLMSSANLLAKPFLHRTLNSSSETMLLSATETRRKRLQRQQTSFELSEGSTENVSIPKGPKKISPHAEYICPKSNPFYQLKCTCSYPRLEPVQENISSCQRCTPTRPRSYPSSMPLSTTISKTLRRPWNRARSSAVRNERKAVKVLGVVFAIFVIAWFPFCITNLLQAVCRRCSVPANLLNSFVWLGYVSSSINPLVYTIFNRNFRLKFLSLLQCQWDRQQPFNNYGSHYHRPTNELRRFDQTSRLRSATVSS